MDKSCNPDLLAQVEGKELLGNETLSPQVVEDGDGPSEAEAGVAQAQDAVEDCIFHELAGFPQTQAKGLGLVDKAPELWEKRVLLRRGLESGAGLGDATNSTEKNRGVAVPSGPQLPVTSQRYGCCLRGPCGF